MSINKILNNNDYDDISWQPLKMSNKVKCIISMFNQANYHNLGADSEFSTHSIKMLSYDKFILKPYIPLIFKIFLGFVAFTTSMIFSLLKGFMDSNSNNGYILVFIILMLFIFTYIAPFIFIFWVMEKKKFDIKSRFFYIGNKNIMNKPVYNGEKYCKIEDAIGLQIINGRYMELNLVLKNKKRINLLYSENFEKITEDAKQLSFLTKLPILNR